MPLILIAMFASASVSTRAQTAYGVRADVPFDFIVGDKTIPAGHITAQGVTTDMAGTLSIRNRDQGDLALRTGSKVPGTDDSDQCKLVFHKYGNHYYLAEVWIPGRQAWEVMKSKEERSLERDMQLAKNFKPSKVIVSATTE